MVVFRDESEVNERRRAFNENYVINIPSSGIVSTAYDWIFTRYIYDNELKKWQKASSIRTNSFIFCAFWHH